MKIAWLPGSGDRTIVPQIDSLTEYLYQMLLYNGSPCTRLKDCQAIDELLPTNAELQSGQQRRFVCLGLNITSSNTPAADTLNRKVYQAFVRWMSTLTAANSERQVRLVILNIQANDGEQNHAALQYNHQISPAFRLVVMYAKPEEISQRLSQLLTEHLQFRWLQLFKLRFLYPATDGACLPVIMPPNEHSKIIPLAEYLERYQPYHQCVRSVTLSPAENTTLITPFAEIMRDEEPKMMLVWFDSPDVAASATVADENEEPSSSAVAEMTGKKFLSYILLYQSNRLQLCQLNYSRTAQQLLCLPSNELLRPRMQRSFRQMEFEQFIQSSRLQSIAKSSWDNNLVAPTKHLQQGVLFDPTQSAFAPLANALVAAFEKPTLSLEETTNLKQMISKASYAADTVDVSCFPQHKGDKEKSRRDFDQLRAELHAFVNRQRPSVPSLSHEDVCRYIINQVKQPSLSGKPSETALLGTGSSNNSVGGTKNTSRQYKPWLERPNDWQQEQQHSLAADGAGQFIIFSQLKERYTPKLVDSYRLNFRPFGWKSPFIDEVGHKSAAGKGKRKRDSARPQLGTGMDMVEF